MRGWKSPRCICGHARTKHRPDYRKRLTFNIRYGMCRVRECHCPWFKFDHHPTRDTTH